MKPTLLPATLAIIALASEPGCGGIESFPGLSVGFVGVAALIGGGTEMSAGRVLEGLGFSALGAGLCAVAFTMLDAALAEAPRLERREVMVALSQGRGALVTDLAADLGLSDSQLPYLGHALRQARARLLAATPGPGDHDWRPFLLALRAVLIEDPFLAPHLEDLERRVSVAAMAASRRD